MNFVFFFLLLWMLQLKKICDVAAATFTNPRPAAVSRLGVSWDAKVSLEGDRKLFAAPPLTSHQRELQFTANAALTRIGFSFSSSAGSDLRCAPLSLWVQQSARLFGCCLSHRACQVVVFVVFVVCSGRSCCAGSDSLLTSNSSSPPPLPCQLAALRRSPTVHHHRNPRVPSVRLPRPFVPLLSNPNETHTERRDREARQGRRRRRRRVVCCFKTHKNVMIPLMHVAQRSMASWWVNGKNLHPNADAHMMRHTLLRVH